MAIDYTIRAVCIGGAPSSGTTLLADILDSIPGVLCGPEAYIFCMDAAYEYSEDFKNKACYARFPCNAIYSPHTRFFNKRHCDAFGVNEEELNSTIVEYNDLPSFVYWLGLKFSKFRKRECVVFAEKTPINVGYIKRFLDTFPQGYFIHSIRDGRDVVSSLTRRGYSLIEAGLIWMFQTSLALTFINHPRVFNIRYEDLIKSPYKIGQEIAKNFGVSIDQKILCTNLKNNHYRRSLGRVDSWRAHDIVPDESLIEKRKTLLSSNEISFLMSLRLKSIFSLATFPELSFKQLLTQFGYDTESKISPTKKKIVEGFIAEYNKKCSKPECQAIFALPPDYTSNCFYPAFADIEKIPTSSHKLLTENMGYIFPDNKYFPLFTSILDNALSNLSNQLILGESRKYHLRKTHVNLSGSLPWPARIKNVLPELIELNMQLLTRRAQARQPLKTTDAAILALIIHQYLSVSGKNWKNKNDIIEHAKCCLGDDVDQIVKHGFEFFYSLMELRDDLFLQSVAESISGSDIVFPVNNKDPVTGILLNLIVDGSDDEDYFLNMLGESFFDVHSGILYTLPIDSLQLRQRRVYYRPLLVFALLRLAKRHCIEIPEFQTVSMRRLARCTGGAGLDEKRSAERVIAHSIVQRTPPKLVESYQPGHLSFDRIEFEAAISEQIKKTCLNSLGYSVRVSSLPYDRRLVFSMRHDVDRPLQTSDVDKIRSFERKMKIVSSWYFKPETFDFDLAHELLNEGCEIGYHASFSNSGDSGFASKLFEIFGNQIQGSTFHGGFGSAFWNGQDSINDIARLGFAYTEIPSDVFSGPCRYNSAFGPIYLTPSSVKVQAYPASIEMHLNNLFKYNGFIILENHPDCFNEKIMELIIKILDKKPIVRTVNEHVSLCRSADEMLSVFSWSKDNRGDKLSGIISKKVFIEITKLENINVHSLNELYSFFDSEPKGCSVLNYQLAPCLKEVEFLFEDINHH